MLELINDIAAKGTMNIILSSHILADVEATCKHVLIMNKGKIISHQDIATTLDRKAMNIIELKLNGNIAGFKEKLSQYRIEQDSKGVFRIHLPEDFRPHSLFKTAYESSVQIRHFRKSKVTLEDAFVTAIGEANAN